MGGGGSGEATLLKLNLLKFKSLRTEQNRMFFIFVTNFPSFSKYTVKSKFAEFRVM